MDRWTAGSKERQDKQNETFRSVHTNESVCWCLVRIWNTQPGRRETFPVFLTAGHVRPIIQNGALMQLIRFLNKAAGAVKWWKQTDSAVMVDQLMNFALGCNTGAKIRAVCSRESPKATTQRIQLQLWFTERARTLRARGDVCVSVHLIWRHKQQILPNIITPNPILIVNTVAKSELHAH